MKQLDLEFLNTAGKTQHLKLKYAKQDLDEGTVRLAMEKMIDTKLFQKEGQLLYVTPKAAQYVETLHEPIFDDNKL